MNNKNIVGNGSKATLPNGQNLSDKIQENKTKHNIENNNSRGTKGTSTADNKQDKNNQQGNKGGIPVGAQEAGTEAARKGLKAAAGTMPWTRWIPQGIRDKVIDKFMDSGMGQAAVEKGLRQLKTKIIMIAVVAVGSFVITLLWYSVLISAVMAPIGWVVDVLKDVGDWFKSFGNWFVGNGWCPNSDECQNKAYQQYYEALDAAVEKYGGSCEINEDLFTATIFYGQMASQDKIESDTNDEDENKDTNDETFYFNYLDVSEAAFRQSATSQLYKLVKVYLKNDGKTVEDLESKEEVEIIIDENNPCSVTTVGYREYLIDTYIGWAYPSVVNENRTKEEIADEILQMGGLAMGGATGQEGEIIVGAGQAGAIPTEILSNCSSPLGTQQMSHTSCFGYYSKTACEEKNAGSHNGVDIGSGVADPKIYSIADGEVVTITRYDYNCPADVTKEVICPGCPKTTGNRVTVKHSIDVDGKTYVFYSEYLHLKRISVDLHQKVSKGQQIGIMGNTGCSTATHLHFNILDENKKRYNPEELLQYLNLPFRADCNDVRNYCYNHQLSLKG